MDRRRILCGAASDYTETVRILAAVFAWLVVWMILRP
jgi:hypothetical protein